MALYCSGIGFGIQNFPIASNGLDHCKINTIYSWEIEVDALYYKTEIGFSCSMPSIAIKDDDYC